MANEFWIIRHGEIAANRDLRWHGATDSRLTPLGRWQARRTAHHLNGTGVDFAALYCSPLQRCRRTAQAIADRLALEPAPVPELSEYAVGEWENHTIDHLITTHDFIARASADHAFAPPGGESLAGVSERIMRALMTLNARHRDENILLVSHGAVMAVALGTLMHDDPGRWVDYHFSNCSITRLVLDPSPALSAFSERHHL